jgi:NADPH-dependent methylglyoxal reductase
VHAIIHAASPISFSLTTLDDFMIPAIGGATGILNSALKSAGPQLESVVVTSSIAAVTNMARPKDHSFTETDWNDYVMEAVKMPDPPAVLFYSASKNAAEKAVWEWRDRNQVWVPITANGFQPPSPKPN